MSTWAFGGIMELNDNTQHEDENSVVNMGLLDIANTWNSASMKCSWQCGTGIEHLDSKAY
jgi:hypothetical protein